MLRATKMAPISTNPAYSGNSALFLAVDKPFIKSVMMALRLAHADGMASRQFNLDAEPLLMSRTGTSGHATSASGFSWPVLLKPY